MRVESSVTSITWIPSEAIQGMPKLPFELGVAHYDDPPPDRIDDLNALRDADAFREANELRAWIEVQGGRITDYGYRGRGLIGVTRVKVPGRELSFPAVKFPLLQSEPEIGPDWVRFVQTAGGRMGLPAPRRVRGKPFFQIASASAWTTLSLIIYADGTSKRSLEGASPFPRHWIYDEDGKLVEKSATIDFKTWYRESHGRNTPWGEEDSPAFTTAVESELERELSHALLRGERKLRRRKLGQGEVLVQQGEAGQDLFLVLDGLFDVEVDGDIVAEVGPGALLGERALLEKGTRTATLRAATGARVAVVPAAEVDEAVLPELARAHRAEEQGQTR
jgi:Cyclic nucleotide-binding domain